MNCKTASLAMVTVALLISGCATPEQRYRQEQQRIAAQRAAAENLRRDLESRCRGYGFQPGTTPFAQCVMQLDQAVRQTAAAQKARKELESKCALAEAEGYLAPTRTGGFAESQQRASAAYSRCMAGLPPAQPLNIICQAVGRDQVRCFNQ
jgi:hypothetical protein